MDQCWFCTSETEAKNECLSWLRECFKGNMKNMRIKMDEGLQESDKIRGKVKIVLFNDIGL